MVPAPFGGGLAERLCNGLPWHRQGDAWETHCCFGACHDSVLASGSGTVHINGKQAGRIGDPVACGSSVATGSPDVLCGE